MPIVAESTRSSTRREDLAPRRSGPGRETNTLDRSQPYPTRSTTLFSTLAERQRTRRDRAYDVWKEQVLTPVKHDAAGLVGGFHFLTLDDDSDDAPRSTKKKKIKQSPSKRPPRPPDDISELEDQSQKALAAAKGVDEGAPDPRVDDDDAKRRAANALCRRRLPKAARLVAVKDVLGHLADYDSANGPPLLFYLPQLGACLLPYLTTSRWGCRS